MAKKKKKRAPPIPATKRKKKKARIKAAMPRSKKVTVRGKGSTPQKLAKVPDLVTGKFFVVTEDQKSVLNPEGVLQPWGKDNLHLFDSKEAAKAELDKQRGLTAALPEEESFVKATVVPVKTFMINDYDFDTVTMKLGCCLTRKEDGGAPVSLKGALSLARTSLKTIVKDTAAALKAVQKNQAAEMRELIVQHARIEKDAVRELAEVELWLETFQAKAKAYGA